MDWINEKNTNMKKITTFIAALLFCIHGNAQTERWDALMAQVKNYTLQKEYAKAIQCNEELIADLEAHGVTGLSETIRNSNALNYLYLAVPLLKEKKYDDSKAYLDKAIENAKAGSKTYYMVQLYFGHWYAYQSLDIKLQNGDLNKAIEYCVNAEQHFEKAQAPDRVLSQKISHAGLLSDLSRNNEAVVLYKGIIEECASDANLDVIRGQALCELGGIEYSKEEYQSAISHLEEAYPLCLKSKDKSYAKITASRLHRLYTNGIPEPGKAKLWEQREAEMSQIINQ